MWRSSWTSLKAPSSRWRNASICWRVAAWMRTLKSLSRKQKHKPVIRSWATKKIIKIKKLVYIFVSKGNLWNGWGFILWPSCFFKDFKKWTKYIFYQKKMLSNLHPYFQQGNLGANVVQLFLDIFFTSAAPICDRNSPQVCTAAGKGACVQAADAGATCAANQTQAWGRAACWWQWGSAQGSQGWKAQGKDDQRQQAQKGRVSNFGFERVLARRRMRA